MASQRFESKINIAKRQNIKSQCHLEVEVVYKIGT